MLNVCFPGQTARVRESADVKKPARNVLACLVINVISSRVGATP